MKTYILALTLMISNAAFSYDIHGQGNYFIKITELNARQDVRFELCLTRDANACRQIGKSASYSKARLHQLRNSEKKDVALAALADIGILGLAVFTGGAGGAAILGTRPVAS